MQADARHCGGGGAHLALHPRLHLSLGPIDNNKSFTNTPESAVFLLTFCPPADRKASFVKAVNRRQRLQREARGPLWTREASVSSAHTSFCRPSDIPSATKQKW